VLWVWGLRFVSVSVVGLRFEVCQCQHCGFEVWGLSVSALWVWGLSVSALWVWGFSVLALWVWGLSVSALWVWCVVASRYSCLNICCDSQKLCLSTDLTPLVRQSINQSQWVPLSSIKTMFRCGWRPDTKQTNSVHHVVATDLLDCMSDSLHSGKTYYSRAECSWCRSSLSQRPLCTHYCHLRSSASAH